MLKATGIVRKVDELGRIVLPVELRRTLGVRQNDPMEIYVDGENVVIQKYRQQCVFCGEHEAVSEFRGKLVCGSCAAALGAFNQR